jgi:hypothetical protein
LFLLLSFHLILVSQALSEELMRTTKNFFASNRCPANISKGAPVEYESRVLLLQRTIRARCWHNDDDYALYFRPPVQRVSYSISWLKTRISRRNFTKKPNECVRMEKMNHLYQTNQNLLSTLNPAWRSRWNGSVMNTFTNGQLFHCTVEVYQRTISWTSWIVSASS